MWKPTVITTDALQIFLKRGGELSYKPAQTPKGWVWELWGKHPDGTEENVINSKTGEPRVFKTTEGLIGFHMRIFPEDTTLTIPLPRVPGEEEDRQQSSDD